MLINGKSLAVIAKQTNWDQMTAFQKTEFINSIKAKSAVMLIQATHFAESKNFQKAKQLLVQIADNCSYVKEPDQQILNWIQVSCSFLAVLYRKQQLKKSKSSKLIEKTGWHNREVILNLSYNKFSGEFGLDKKKNNYQEGFITQQVLQYASKINAILIGCFHGGGNYSSLYVMFSSYWVAFTIAFTLLIITFIYLILPSWFGINISSSFFQAQPIIFGAILVIPFFMIYSKVLQQKDSTFFEKKLGEQIKKINNDCKQRKLKIEFMMPQGGQINIKYSRFNDEQEESNGLDGLEDDSIDQTPESEIMDQIKGLTRDLSRLSGVQLSSYKRC